MGRRRKSMALKRNSKIFPHLWYAKEAEEAARFYASIFPDSRVDRVTTLQSETPSGPPGSVKVVDFTLFGQRFQAISAGPLDPFNHAISLVVACEDQPELDRYWNALLEGGTTEMCGWLRDRYGVSWQIVPAIFDEMMADSDAARLNFAIPSVVRSPNPVRSTSLRSSRVMRPNTAWPASASGVPRCGVPMVTREATLSASPSREIA